MKIDSAIGGFMYEKLIELGVPEAVAIYVKLAVLLGFMAIIALFLLFIGRRIVLNTVQVIAKRSKSQFDDKLVKHRVFYRISFLLPVLAFYIFDSVIFQDFPKLHPYLDSLTNLFLVLVIIWSVDGFLNATREFLENSKFFKNKPVNSYIQLLKIIIYMIAGIVVISILIGKSPIYLLTGLGAVSAVLILVFKDTIIGFMASIQIAMNDMVRVGDWVSVPQYGADGDVIEINLVTVKVHNWDKTISMVPTYAFVSDSFKNWRGMQESGGRRIKRHLNIDVNSIRFANKDLVERLKKIQLLKPYLEARQKEIDEDNSNRKVDVSDLANGRRLTNVGIFRKYADLYIENHPKVNESMTRMVRQLQPTEHGLPLEVYCFSTDKRWEYYEELQGDIFDHLFAVANEFDLQIFQAPTGRDFASLKS